MGNRFVLIEEKIESIADVANAIRRLAENLRGTVIHQEAKTRLLELLRKPEVVSLLNPTRIQWIWNDAKKHESVEGLRTFMVNLSRFMEKEGAIDVSWDHLAAMLGDLEKSDDQSESTPLIQKRKKLRGKFNAKEKAQDIVKAMPDDVKLKKESVDPQVRWDEAEEDERRDIAIKAGFKGKESLDLAKKSWAFLSSDERKDLEWAIKASPEHLPEDADYHWYKGKKVEKGTRIVVDTSFGHGPSVEAVVVGVGFEDGQPVIDYETVRGKRKHWAYLDQIVKVLEGSPKEPEEDPDSNEHFLAPMVPFGAASAGGAGYRGEGTDEENRVRMALKRGQEVEVQRGPYRGLRGVVESAGKLLTIRAESYGDTSVRGGSTRIRRGEILVLPEDAVEALPGQIPPTGIFDTARPPSIDQKTKTAINKYLDDISRKYWDDVPMRAIEEKFKEYGLTIDPYKRDPANLENDPEAIGKSGQASLNIYKGGEEVRNARLNISWYVMPSGKYELVLYI